MSPTRSGWLIDVLIGGAAGGVVAVVAALNLMIYLGPESGYETSIGELFAHSFLAGLLVVAALMTGPVLGVVLMRRWRHSRHDSRGSRPT